MGKSLDVVLHIFFFTALIGVLCGGYVVEYFFGHTPCALCYLQRLAMILAALCILINLQHGATSQSLGVCVLASLVGCVIALRHNALRYCCPENGHPLVLGKSLPQWSFLVFGCALAGIAVLLLVGESGRKAHPKIVRLCFIAICLTVLVGCVSVFSTRGCGF